MSFQDLVTASQKHFPDLKIKYKDQSFFMKLLGKIMFFNKGFMTDYTTTIGSTIYFPSEATVKARPVSSAAVLLHELIHVYDAKKLTKPFFGFLYLTPQIFALLAIPLFFLNWKLALPFLLFALPIPSYFRMHFEKKAYMTSLYVINALGNRMNFKPLLATQQEGYLAHFKDSSYYYMWPFDLRAEFDEAVNKIKNGERPFEDPIFDIMDELVTTV